MRSATRFHPVALLVLAAVAVSAAAGPPAEPAWFVADPVNSTLLPATPSSAIAWGDANGDGFADLWAGNHGQPTLFINHAGVLRDDSEQWRIKRTGDSHGVAWGDADNDGRLDLVELLGGERGRGTGQGNRLYLNRGGHFEEITAMANISPPGLRGRVPLWYDVDRDQQLDLLLTAALRDGDDGPVLLRQQSLVFAGFGASYPFDRNMSSEYAQIAWVMPGTPALVLHRQSYPGAAYRLDGAWQRVDAAALPPATDFTRDSLWADLNGDGNDDLVLARQVTQSTFRQPAPGRLEVTLMKAPGPEPVAVTFRASAKIKVSVYPHAPIWWHREVVYVGDRQLAQADLLPRNQQQGLHFRVRATDNAIHGPAPVPPGRALQVWFDADTDRWRLSLHGAGGENGNVVITSDQPIAQPSLEAPRAAPPPARQFLSTPTGYAARGLPPEARFCAALAGGDFDNDGDLDLFLSCGANLDNATDLALENDGNGNFHVKPGEPFTPTAGIADSVAVADYNRDGALDLAVSNGAGQRPFNEGPLQFFHGVPNGNHWLQVDLTPPVGTAFPYGARLHLTAGGVTQSRTVDGGLHVGGQHEQVLHFGLGKADQVERLELVFPEGRTVSVSDITVDQRYRLPAALFAQPVNTDHRAP